MADPTPTAAPTRPNEDVILEAALDAFGSRGFYGASMRDIARLSGVSLSNLYNYFPGKSQLLAEVLRRANGAELAQVQQAVDAAGPSPGPRLGAAVRAFVAFVVDHQVAALVALSEVRYLVDDDREHVVRARDITQGIFETIIADGVASGEFRTPYPRDAARNISAMCSAIATWYRPGGRLSRDELADEQARYAAALLEARTP